MQMRSRLNIVFSSTRQFNCGDEFILFGIINLLESMNMDFNPIIYNRNPDIRSGSYIYNRFKTKKETHKLYRGKYWIKSLFDMDFWDNSIKDDSNWEYVDLVVFAGTPEWYGKRVETLYKNIVKFNIPCIYLGIGVGEPNIVSKLSKLEREVLKHSLFISVRDQNAYELLKEYGAIMITCPSILSSRSEKEICGVNKVGLIYSSSRVSINNSISRDTESFEIELYKKLIEKYDCELICHYIEELDYINDDFPGVLYNYSYDSSSYFDIYKKFDMVIGCRVHGIGISASLGIPGVAIKHSIRSDTVKSMGAEIIDINSMNVSEAMSIIEKQSRRIIEESIHLKMNKTDTANMYRNELESIFRHLKLI